MAYLVLQDGRNLWYEEEGQGRPVVFLHGWKASADVFGTPSRLLADRFRCIRYDCCGHMRSDPPKQGPDLAALAEDLRQVLTALTPEPPVLVGWSMGGMTVLEYLRRYGCGSIAGIVLVDIGPYRMTEPDRLAKEMALANRDFHEFMRWYYSNRVPGFADLQADEQDLRIRKRMQGHHPAVLTALWQSFCRRDQRDVLPKITCPTGIFRAGVMPGCSEETARYYADHIPVPTTVVCFEENSHSLILEDPQRFAAELRTFLEA